jgi:hypothetical protein
LYRWNAARGSSFEELKSTSTSLFINMEMYSEINSMSERLFGCGKVPQKSLPGKFTGQSFVIFFNVVDLDSNFNGIIFPNPGPDPR